MDVDLALLRKALVGGRDSWEKLGTDGVERSALEGDGLLVYDFVADRIASGSFPSLGIVMEQFGHLRWPDDSRYMWGSLVEGVRTRRVANLLSPVLEAAKTSLGKGEVWKALERVKEAIGKAEEEGAPAIQVRTLLSLGGVVVERYKHAQVGDWGIAAPWPSIDGMTGRFQKRSVTYFLGRPGSGKSSCGLLCARHAWTIGGRRVLLVSPEMDADEVAEVFYVVHAGLPYSKVVLGELADEEQDRLCRMVSDLEGDDGLHVLDVHDRLTPERVEAAVRKIEPDLVLFDSVYELWTDKIRDQWERLDFTTAYIKDVTKSCMHRGGIAVLANSQLKRGVGDAEDATLDDAGMTDKIAQRAQNVFKIWRKVPDDVTDNVLRLSPLKVRRRAGWKSQVCINWDWRRCDFSEIQPKGKQFHDDGQR